MSFGIQNLGVINQKDAPAIWESDFVDFPANFVKGRILIAIDSGAIYIDLTASRLQIQAGSMASFTAANGLTKTSGSFDTEISLGGILNGETVIDLDGSELKLLGSSSITIFTSDGKILDDSTSSFYMPMKEETFAVIVPDSIIRIFDLDNGQSFQILAKKLP
jgi:hypothetical protein